MKYRTWLPRWRPKKRGKLRQNKLRNNLIDFFTELIPNGPKYRKVQTTSHEDTKHNFKNTKEKHTKKTEEICDIVSCEANESHAEMGAGDVVLDEQNEDGFEFINLPHYKQNDWAFKALLLIKPYEDNATCGSDTEFRDDQQENTQESLSKFKIPSLTDLCSKVINTDPNTVVNEPSKIKENEFTDEDEKFPESEPSDEKIDAETEINAREKTEEISGFVEKGNDEINVDSKNGSSVLPFEITASITDLRKEDILNCGVKRNGSYIEDSESETFSAVSSDNSSEFLEDNSSRNTEEYLESKSTNSQGQFEEAGKNSGGMIRIDEPNRIPSDGLQILSKMVDRKNLNTLHGLEEHTSTLGLISSCPAPETSVVVNDHKSKCEFPFPAHNDASQPHEDISKLSKCTESFTSSSLDGGPNNQRKMKGITTQTKNESPEISNMLLKKYNRLLFHEDVQRKIPHNPFELIMHKDFQSYLPTLNMDSPIVKNLPIENKQVKRIPKCSSYKESKDAQRLTHIEQNTDTQKISKDIQQDENSQIFNLADILRMARNAQTFGHTQQNQGTQVSNCIQQNPNNETDSNTFHDKIAPLFNCIQQKTNNKILNRTQQGSNSEKIIHQRKNIKKIIDGQQKVNADMCGCFLQSAEVQIGNCIQPNEGNKLSNSILQDSNAEGFNCPQHGEDIPIFGCSDMKDSDVSGSSGIQQIAKLPLVESDVVFDSKHSITANLERSSKVKTFGNFEEVLAGLDEYLSNENNITERRRQEMNFPNISTTGNASPYPFKDNEKSLFNKIRFKKLDSVDSEVRGMFDKLNIKSNISEIFNEPKSEEKAPSLNLKPKRSNIGGKKVKCFPDVLKTKTPPLKKSRQTKYGVTSITNFTYVRKRSNLISTKFSQKFNEYSKYGNNRKSGFVITNERSLQWLADAGFFEDATAVDAAMKCFTKSAGGKIVLSVHEYVRYLMKLFGGKFWSDHVIDRLSDVPSLCEQENGSGRFFSVE